MSIGGCITTIPSLINDFLGERDLAHVFAPEGWGAGAGSGTVIAVQSQRHFTPPGLGQQWTSVSGMKGWISIMKILSPPRCLWRESGTFCCVPPQHVSPLQAVLWSVSLQPSSCLFFMATPEGLFSPRHIPHGPPLPGQNCSRDWWRPPVRCG